jgi:hypothetical protein
MKLIARNVDFKRVMTVGDLKKLLADIPDETEVGTEGCDCYGPSCGINLMDGKLYISRDDNLRFGE